MFKDKMRTEAIPERVYTLCKIVEKKPISESDLKSMMEPDYLGNNSSYFNYYKTAASELNLISISDHTVSLAVNPKFLQSIGDMRQYINSNIGNLENSQFYKVTQAYFHRGTDILYSSEKNIAQMASSFSVELGIPLDEDGMRAWRFWASFLGLGYLQGMQMLPNACVYLRDCINNASVERGKRMSFGRFIEQVRPYLGILGAEDTGNHEINFGISNGLRALHDAGYIKMEHIMDQQDLWQLYHLSAHSISGTVTNITIYE